jgi:hypothetical protein
MGNGAAKRVGLESGFVTLENCVKGFITLFDGMFPVKTGIFIGTTGQAPPW